MVEDKEIKKENIEREFTIPLRKEWDKVPDYKKANRAIKAIKKFLARHMKVYDRDLNKVKLDKFLNEYVWARGIKNPPIKVKVKAWRDGEIIRAELVELPESFRFKKAKLEKRGKKAEEALQKKKPEKKEEKPAEEAKPGETEKREEETHPNEAKLEEKEKKAAVVQAGKEMEKKIAKTQKHQTKISKQPKRQFRQALQK